jgi:transcriptional regulator with XRE-family HTH domain
MTAQKTHTVERAAAGREVELLLATGPFAAALRAAIRARGLGLDRIRYRLRSRGVSISLATLSHWQSGRCRPERSESLVALAHIEEVLRVPPGSLTHLLGPPRSRARGSCAAHRTVDGKVLPSG